MATAGKLDPVSKKFETDSVWQTACLIASDCQMAHGMAYLSRGDMIEAISLDLFCPNFDSACETVSVSMCTQINIAKGTPLKPGHVPTSRGPFSHLTMDCIDLSER